MDGGDENAVVVVVGSDSEDEGVDGVEPASTVSAGAEGEEASDGLVLSARTQSNSVCVASEEGSAGVEASEEGSAIHHLSGEVSPRTVGDVAHSPSSDITVVKCASVRSGNSETEDKKCKVSDFDSVMPLERTTSEPLTIFSKTEPETRPRSTSESHVVIDIKPHLGPQRQTKNVISTLSTRFLEELCHISMGQPLIDDFFCQMCLENHPETEAVKLLGCGHVFCRDSLCGYFSVKVADGDVLSIVCPHVDADGEFCQNDIQRAQLEELLPEEVFQKFCRFKEVKTNIHFRECPKCDAAQEGNPKKPAMLCSACGTSFCYFHNDAHPNVSCGKYQRQSKYAEKESKAWKSQNAKRCPKCRNPTEKNGGCSHMTCKCGQHWCWMCGYPMQGGSHKGVWPLLRCPLSNGNLVMRSLLVLSLLAALPIGLALALIASPFFIYHRNNKLVKYVVLGLWLAPMLLFFFFPLLVPVGLLLLPPYMTSFHVKDRYGWASFGQLSAAVVGLIISPFLLAVSALRLMYLVHFVLVQDQRTCLHKLFLGFSWLIFPLVLVFSPAVVVGLDWTCGTNEAMNEIWVEDPGA